MSGWFMHAKEEFLNKQIDMDTDNLKAILVDLSAVTSAGVKTITAATNATPIVVTSTSHGFSNGDIVSIRGVTGNTNANGRRKIANVTANTFELTDPRDDTDIAGNGTYGGTDTIATNLSIAEDLADIDSAAILQTSGNLSSVTIVDGLFDCADITFSSVPNDGKDGHTVIVYHDTPAADADKTLICMDDQSSDFIVNGNGGDITYNVNASGFGQL
jgi:hypothetical protein